MKIISLLQPWASLVVLGHKKLETRGWNTKHRGPLLIHASGKFTKEQERLSFEFSQMLKDSRVYHCPRGAIIGQIDLIGTVKSELCFPGNVFEHVVKQHHGPDTLYQWEITEQERAFGDHSPGRFGWFLGKPVLFSDPIPAKGSLSLWEYPLMDAVITLPTCV